MGDLSFSVVIPVYNSMAFLPDALEAVKAQSIKAAEIIIVDSENCQKTADLAKQYNASCYNIANNIAEKRNFGANKASSDIVVFLDSDCLLPESWLAAAGQFFAKAEIVACGCSYFELPENSHFLVQAWHQHQIAFQKEQTAWLPTSALAVRKKIFNEISGFNERLPACEDVDLGYRLNNHGLLVDSQKLSHIHLNNPDSLFLFFTKEYWRGQHSFELAIKNRSNLKEIIYLLIPLYAVAILAAIIMFAISFSSCALTLLLITLSPIFALSLYVTSRTNSWLQMPALSLSYLMYLFARSTAFLRNMIHR